VDVGTYEPRLAGAARLALNGVSDEAPREERVRAAEVIGALCLATDLGMGFPFEHGLHSTLIAIRLAERTTSDWTAPATIALPAARSWPFPHACWQPPTPTKR
jgi:hypothetical protein